MLTQLVKQIWLVVLMVFAIGCSSVSMAAATSMHLGMSAEHMSSHCLQMAKSATAQHSHEPVHAPDPDMTQTDCHPDTAQHAQNCLDCNATSCHSLFTALQITTPELTAVGNSQPEKNPLPTYHARHLAGYWQEILRPPKA